MSSQVPTLPTRVWPQTGESLVDGEHYASHEIETRVEELFAKWEELLEATDSKRLGLEQAPSLVHFNRKVCTYYKEGGRERWRERGREGDKER